MKTAQMHMVTCGTSVLANYRKDAGAKHIAAGERSTVDDPATGLVTPGNITALSSFLKTDADKKSAELNSIMKFGLDRVQHVYLLNTDTDEGELCAAAIEAWLKGNRVLVDRKRIKGFGSGNFADGLVNLRNAVVDIIKANYKTHFLYLNCTGGFKPEASMLVLLASIFAIPAYYIYETSRELVMIPPLPIPVGKNLLKVACEELARGPLFGKACAGFKDKWTKQTTRGDESIYDYMDRIGFIQESTSTTDGSSGIRLSTTGRLYLENYVLSLESLP